MSHEQVTVAIAIEIACEDRPGPIKRQGIEAGRLRHIGETAAAQVSQQTDLAAIGALAHSRQIEPTIVVEVDGGDSPPPAPPGLRRAHAFKTVAR